jgi:hypothetical protein
VFTLLIDPVFAITRPRAACLEAPQRAALLRARQPGEKGAFGVTVHVGEQLYERVRRHEIAGRQPRAVLERERVESIFTESIRNRFDVESLGPAAVSPTLCPES